MKKMIFWFKFTTIAIISAIAVIEVLSDSSIHDKSYSQREDDL
ncbi:hypothetical protein [Murimonas intestini]|uniref:Uncharacterized protein n=1 Tax=Murimonas intestini TaxID=1337051 RepID=A0AB73TA13_9FIRM|nr:hypothetical protein [Murimonas intestini]MCR1839213.1 hypothetical protein [Murimonas intestini]MCR1864509.1 hypothetical protein [Murimonas intestini]MCR1882119.1 hypothetical protein [Murimonas intestini]